MSDRKQWHAWVIKRNHFDNVIQFIQEKVSEVDKFFYPQIKKEYETKRGVKVKDRPLYEGYLFLRYDGHPVVFHKLSSYPFVTTYAGPIEDEEISRMEEVQGKLLSEIKATKFRKGDTVVLLDGPFKGYEAKVKRTEGEIVKVFINAPILGKTGVEMAYPEDQVERKAELQNAVVQDLN